jgi:hypothetical protein
VVVGIDPHLFVGRAVRGSVSGRFGESHYRFQDVRRPELIDVLRGLLVLLAVLVIAAMAVRSWEVFGCGR